MSELKTFKIPMDEATVERIQDQTISVVSKQNQGKAPQYTQFVDDLFKHMGNQEECLIHAAIGVAGEGGEILDCAKRQFIYGKDLDVENLIEELGDIRFYYQQMLNMLGLNDQDIRAANMVKLMKRYPEGKYSDFHANARLDKGEE
ncbi:MazG [Alteromonas phage vB_AcoS-R7M]|uniref:MazG n=1 Tax=Alteromonas phage vB_AcoS-R7M TaxID=2729541 RepID=A0A6M3YTI9_9CAUD|nr:MazG-like pyrophosphatase [Alteromonas phage vB_AcoS-R7M]QJI53386.1 MazG [Alteromonas phage vB_AcoS-R7M]